VEHRITVLIDAVEAQLSYSMVKIPGRSSKYIAFST
jgi:hypothetical protein